MLSTQDVVRKAGFQSMPFRIVPPTEMENIQWAGDPAPINALMELFAPGFSPQIERFETD